MEALKKMILTTGFSCRNLTWRARDGNSSGLVDEDGREVSRCSVFSLRSVDCDELKQASLSGYGVKQIGRPTGPFYDVLVGRVHALITIVMHSLYSA